MADTDNPAPEPTPTPPPTPEPPSNNPPLPQWLEWAKKILPTNWRAFVVWAFIAITTTGVNCLRGPEVEPLPIPEPPTPVFPPDGWVKPSEEDIQATLALPNVYQFRFTEANNVVGDDSDAPAWRFYEKTHGVVMPVRNQLNLGSCVSFGFGGIIELCLAAQHILKTGPPQKKVPAVVQEVIYGGSRVNIHGRPALSGDGSTGAWAVKWLSTGGIIARDAVVAGKSFGSYNVDLCRDWGNKGVPAELLPACKENLVTQYALVTTAEEAKKALQQGYPIAVCSDVGFASSMPISRDQDGFLKRQGSWGHCMFIAGYQGGSRPGFLIVNSWGPGWVTGPKGKFADIPEGSFWADFATVNQMLSQRDSYSVSGVGGFKKNKIDRTDWIIRNTKQDFFFGRRANAGEFFLAP